MERNYTIYIKLALHLGSGIKLFDKAKKCGLIAFSTPLIYNHFFFKKLSPPCYKISSFENTFHFLIKKVSKTKKPIIISTGLASKKEIEESVK